jgi:hypothetical protein
VQDNGGTANGGVDLDPSANTITINVTSVNDAPSFTKGGNQTINEDAPAQTVTPWATGISAGPADESSQTLSFHASNNNGSLFSGQPSIAANGTLTYTPASNANGSATVSVYLTDDGGTANGGVDTSLVQTFTITVRSVNDEPAGTDKTVTIAEDGTKTFATADFGFSDPSDSPANSLLAVKITTLPANGTLKLNGLAVAAGDIVSATDIAAGKLTFTPVADASGTPYTSFTFQVQDNGGTAYGGVDLDQSVNSITINVTAVNDHPVVTSNRASQNVQYSDAIQVITISATDIDSPASSLTASPQGVLPSGLSLTATGAGTSFPRTWTLTGTAGVPAGTYVIRINVDDHASTDNIGYTDVTIVVGPEDALIDYTGDSLKATASPSTSSATVVLSAAVKETQDGSLGDKLNTASLRFDVYKSNNTTMATADYSCTAPIIASGAGTGTATCSPSLTLPVDNYVVKITYVDGLAGNYYDAPDEVVAVTVTYPGTGFTTGGGWLNETNLQSRSNFGFTVKYLKNGNIQGNSLYIYRKTVAANTIVNPAGGFLPAGVYNWIIKANAMTALTQSCTATTPKVCKASFTGKSNVTAVNRTTGIAYSLGGNRSFQVDVTDAAEPGSSPGAGPDAYAIRVWDSSGTYYQFGTAAAPIAIAGGNIQVRP